MLSVVVNDGLLSVQHCWRDAQSISSYWFAILDVRLDGDRDHRLAECS
jgi:hypothetical protein